MESRLQTSDSRLQTLLKGIMTKNQLLYSWRLRIFLPAVKGLRSKVCCLNSLFFEEGHFPQNGIRHLGFFDGFQKGTITLQCLLVFSQPFVTAPEAQIGVS